MSHQFRKCLLFCIVVCPLLGLTAGGLFTLLEPKVYESRCVFQVRPPSGAIYCGISTSPAKPGFLPSTAPTDLPLVTSDKALNTVIDDLSLSSRWGLNRHSTRKRLRESIRATVIPGTDLIEIRVHANTPDDARMITERVYEAFRAKRTKIEGDRYLKAMEELRDAVQRQEDTVEDRRKTMITIIRNQGLHKRREQIKFNSESYMELQDRIILLESQIKTLLRYDGDQLVSFAVGLPLPENTFRILVPQYLEAKRNLDALKLAGLGEKHPNIKQLQEGIEGMRRDLEEGVITLRETLKEQLELTRKQADELSSKFTDHKGCIVDRPSYSFDEAKSEFETSQRLLEQLKIKLVGEEMQRRITASPVILHEEPCPSESPSYPTLSTNLGIGLLGGLAAGITLPFLALPFLSRSPND